MDRDSHLSRYNRRRRIIPVAFTSELLILAVICAGGLGDIGAQTVVPLNTVTSDTVLTNTILLATESDLTTSVDATLTAATQSGLDTNGFNATWSGSFSGSGGFTKSGAGTLTLSGANRSFGFFNAAQGATVQTAGVTTSPEFTVGSGTGANGTFTLSGGSIVIDGAPPFGGSSSGLRVGDFGGTGVFNQTAGTITIGSATMVGSFNVGNQGGTGTYNLSGGSLILARGLHNLGRNVVGSTASSGTLNLSGSGLLEVIDGTSLVLGDRDANGLTGTGVINQTGGTLRLTNGSLYLSAYGNGTYNLNGGTLEAGGNTSVLANYAGAGTATFNLGGGTIKVIGSDLSVAAHATFISGSLSTFDTNGFAATWSGNLGGAGGLIKTGLGTLTLSGTNTYAGDTNVNQGTLRLGTAGALSPNTTLAVASGAFFDANGFAQAFTNLAGTGTIDVGTAGVSVTPTETNVFTGTIAGSGGLTMNGTGTLVLANTNNFSGATTITQGTLKLAAAGALPTGTTLSLGSTATLDLDGHAATLGQLAGTGQVALGSANLTISQNASSTFSGGISGTGGLIKNGSGLLVLGGTNDFSGTTSVAGGELKITGSANNSDFTVAGGTLSGTGTIGSLNLSSGGTLSPGNSPGTLTAGTSTWAGGGNYAWEINDGTGAAGTNWDLLAITGSLSITATSANKFSLSLISLLPNNDPGHLIHFNDNNSYSYVLATTVGGITGFDPDDFTINTSAFSNANVGTWSLSSSGYNLTLNFTPVPEPGTWALLLIGLTLLVVGGRPALRAGTARSR